MYCVVGVRRTLKSIISSCQVCRLMRTTPRNSIMGQLPKDRLEPYARPFQNIDIDYCGPFMLTVGRKKEKRWVALFTCLSVPAINFKLAHDHSIDAFIIDFKKFINRRGVPIVFVQTMEKISLERTKKPIGLTKFLKSIESRMNYQENGSSGYLIVLATQ